MINSSVCSVSVKTLFSSQMAVTHAQTSNAHSVLYSQMLSDPSPHAYQLFVDRRNLIKDTMAQLVTSDALVNFKKPLVVC